MFFPPVVVFPANVYKHFRNWFYLKNVVSQMLKKSLLMGFVFFGALFAFVIVGQAAVTVDGTNYEIEISGDTYDLDEIWADGSVDDTHIVNYTDGTWLLNWSLIVEDDAVFDPSQGVTGCTWIKLNASNATGHDEAHISVQGKAFFNDTWITGWNYTGDCNMTHYDGCFRPYIYVHPTAHTDTPWCSFKNCTIGYLGTNNDNEYGIVYEDDLLESTDVDASGYMHNCTVMENYHGITFQGCEDMDVSDTYFNDTLEAGIVYTVGGATGNGAHGGNIGDTANLDLPSGQYSKVRILDCHGDLTAMGIRIYGSNNITMDDVEIDNATTEGLWLQTVNNNTASTVIVHHCTNAADDYQVSLNNVTNSTFTSCSAYVPDGAADGGNWYIGDSLGSGWSAWNVFTSCVGYLSAAHEDFFIDKVGSHHNNFTGCTANNSLVGFFVWYANNNTISNCVAHNHTYGYKIESGDYNRVNDSFANDSTIGIYIIDTADSDLAHHNSFHWNKIYYPTSYGFSIGSDGGSDNWCHNNTIDDVTVYGTTTGDGFFFFDNVTYNNATDCFVTGLVHVNSVGFGMSNHAHHNTFHASLAHSNTNTGFALMQAAHDNEIVSCTGSSCQEGLTMSGNNIQNNTVRDFLSQWNDWGLWAWSSASNNNRNNYVNNSEFRLNDYAGIDIGRIGLNTFYNNIIHNNTYGIEIRQGAQPFFTMTLSYNHTDYDWIIESSSVVDIYSTYVLYPNVVNTVGSATASISHDADDGYWNLTTVPIQITIDAGTCDITMTDYTHTFIQWTGTALAGDLTQTIGGLEEDTTYDLLVDYDSYGRATTEAATLLDNSTFRVQFPYTGGWSTHTFAVREVTGGGGGADGGAEPQDDEEPEQDTDGDGYTDAEEIAAGSDPYDATSTPATVPLKYLGVEWYIWVAIGIIIVLAITIPVYFYMYPKTWKKFKKYFK